MGTTKISWLKKIRSGYAFREDFESDNFINNDAWQLLQGLAITSDAQQSQGTYSLDLANSLDSSGMPVVIRENMSTSALYADWMVTVWFYDDLNYTLPGPFIKAKVGTGYLQIGAKNDNAFKTGTGVSGGYPRGCTSHAGFLYACSYANNKIVKIKENDLTLDSQIGSLGTGNDNFNIPSGITNDGTYLYITDTGNSRVVKRRMSDLSYVSEIGSIGTGNDNFNNPMGCTNDGTYLYVMDSANSRVVKRLLSTLAYDSQIGTLGTGNDNFNYPRGCTSDSTYIYITDRNNSRVVKRLMSDLSYVSEFGSFGTGNDQLKNAEGCCNDGTYLYVTDTGNSRIMKRKLSDLTYVSKFGSSGSGDLNYAQPNGCATDGLYLYVCDFFNDRIMKILLDFTADSTHYSCNPSDSVAEDVFSATSVVRTNAWHKFQIYHPTGAAVALIYIDDVLVRYVSGASSTLASINLQGSAVGAVTGSFGYFDDLRVQYSKDAGFYFSGSRTILIGSTSIGGTGLFTPDILPADNSYQIQISKTTSATKLDLNWYGMNFVGGDFWIYQEIDFGRKAFPFDSIPMRLSSQNISPTGGRETTVTGRQDTVSISVQVLEGDVWRQHENDFFMYASLGKPVSIQTDSSDAVLTTVSSIASPSAGANAFYVNSSLGVTAAGIVKGGMYILESADRSKRQILTVDSVSSNHVVFNEVVADDYSTGDVIRSIRFWPMMIMDNPKQSALSYSNAAYKRQTWAQRFVEYVP